MSAPSPSPLAEPRIAPLPGGEAALVRTLAAPTRPDVDVLVLPDWQGGLTAYAARLARGVATALAGRGLAADVLVGHPYPPDVSPRRWAEEGRGLVRGLLADRPATRRFADRLLAAAADAWADASAPLVTVGVCLGGTLAFEAGRLDGRARLAISLHGTPSSDPRAPAASEATAFAFIGGGADPMIDDAALAAFVAEMRAGRRAWSLSLLGHARHSFTKAEVGRGDAGSGYDEDAFAAALDAVAALSARAVLGGRAPTTAP